MEAIFFGRERERQTDREREKEREQVKIKVEVVYLNLFAGRKTGDNLLTRKEDMNI